MHPRYPRHRLAQPVVGGAHGGRRRRFYFLAVFSVFLAFVTITFILWPIYAHLDAFVRATSLAPMGQGYFMALMFILWSAMAVALLLAAYICAGGRPGEKLAR